MMLAAEIQSIYEGLASTEQEIFDAVVQVTYEVEPAFQNRLQWQKPTFTLNNNWHHWIFSLAKTKKGVTVSFHKGWLLEDPDKALGGDGPHLRVLRYTSPDQIQKDVLADLLRSVIRHQLDME